MTDGSNCDCGANYLMLRRFTVSIMSNVFVSVLKMLLSVTTHFWFKKQFEISVKEQASKSCAYLGTVVFKLYDDVVPLTARNFRELALGCGGLGYKDTTFSRIIPQFIIQGGKCLTIGGSGDKSVFGDTFQGTMIRSVNV